MKMGMSGRGRASRGKSHSWRLRRRKHCWQSGGSAGPWSPELAPVRVRGYILLAAFFSGTVRTQLEAELKPEGPKDARFGGFLYRLEMTEIIPLWLPQWGL
ncbi:hypothetical protein K1719_025707 [Acacia pycnantha]|nr:hypothetical protein K1719_040460 [Acacia pycnantha]KAI9097936.1 hypothetical protein K1719_025707 [Acacia pycnantha]